MLPDSHELKQNLIENVRNNLDGIDVLRHFDNREYSIDSDYIKAFNTVKYSPENGVATGKY